MPFNSYYEGICGFIPAPLKASAAKPQEEAAAASSKVCATSHYKKAVTEMREDSSVTPEEINDSERGYSFNSTR